MAYRSLLVLMMAAAPVGLEATVTTDETLAGAPRTPEEVEAAMTTVQTIGTTVPLVVLQSTTPPPMVKHIPLVTTAEPHAQAGLPSGIVEVTPVPPHQVSEKDKVIAGAVAGSLGGAALFAGLLGGLLADKTTAAPSTAANEERERFLIDNGGNAASQSLGAIVAEHLITPLSASLGTLALITCISVAAGLECQRREQSRKRATAESSDLEAIEPNDDGEVNDPLMARSVPEVSGMTRTVTVPPVYVLPTTGAPMATYSTIEKSPAVSALQTGFTQSATVTAAPVYVLPASAPRVVTWTHTAYQG